MSLLILLQVGASRGETPGTGAGNHKAGVQPASHWVDGPDQAVAESLDHLPQRANLQQLVQFRASQR